MADNKRKESTKTLRKACQEHQFSGEKIGKMPTTKPYSDKTKIKSPLSRGF